MLGGGLRDWMARSAWMVAGDSGGRRGCRSGGSVVVQWSSPKKQRKQSSGILWYFSLTKFDFWFCFVLAIPGNCSVFIEIIGSYAPIVDQFIM